MYSALEVARATYNCATAAAVAASGHNSFSSMLLSNI